MRTYLFPLFFLLVSSMVTAHAQPEPLVGLRWVESQANRIDNLLEDAIQAYGQTDLSSQLLFAHRQFEAVLAADLTCLEVNRAASEGLRLTDVINYAFGKDLLTATLRASHARLAAEKMRLAARTCETLLVAPAFSL